VSCIAAAVSSSGASKILPTAESTLSPRRSGRKPGARAGKQVARRPGWSSSRSLRACSTRRGRPGRPRPDARRLPVTTHAAEAQLARQHVTKTLRHAPRRYRFEAEGAVGERVAARSQRARAGAPDETAPYAKAAAAPSRMPDRRPGN
jgi:hypothetical protein